MNDKRPYNHLLKNLFHEKAAEIIPLLLPNYKVEEALDIEMPDLESIPVERPPSPLEEGVVGLILPEARVVGVYKTRWIEHSGVFERVYRVTCAETRKPSFLIIEFQIESDARETAHSLLANFASIDRQIREKLRDAKARGEMPEETDDDEEATPADDRQEERKGTIINAGYYIDPVVLCPFPQAVPESIRDEFMGRVMLEFNFQVIGLWERDAREFLNRQVRSSYFLLPMMKNADAALLGLAIAELTQQFKNALPELARYLTGLNTLLQRSEMMTEEEKLAAQKHLEPFAHLLDETLI